MVYTGDYDGLFSCIDIKKGEILWKWSNPKSNLPILGSPSIYKNIVIIGGEDKFLRCFDRSNGTLKWSFNAGGRIDASPVIVRDKVFVGTMDGMLYMINVNSGAEEWSYEVGSAIAHNPAVVSGYIILGARDGNIYCFGK
jgi:outer membrane protein assembly factor BamB